MRTFQQLNDCLIVYIILYLYNIVNEQAKKPGMDVRIMGEMEKNDKNYVAQASKFYVERLSDKYGKEHEDIKKQYPKYSKSKRFCAPPRFVDSVSRQITSKTAK